MQRQLIREVDLLKALPRPIWTSYLGEIRQELGSYTGVDQAKASHESGIEAGVRDWLPELSIPGRGHADFSLEGFVKGYSRFIAEKLCDLFYLDIVLEQAGCSVHAPTSEIRDRGLTHKTGKASGEY